MKRKPLLFLGLLAVIVACLFWLYGGPQPAKPSAAPASPVAAGASTATHQQTAVAAKTAPGLLTGTNRLAFRLSNTGKSLTQLLQDPHAILLQDALIDTAYPLGLLNIPKNLQAKGDPGAYIVQAHGVISPAFRALLQAAGARIVSYIPNNAYLVQISAAGAGMLSANALVQAVLPYQPYYKLQPSLLALAVADAPLPPGLSLTVGLFDEATLSQMKGAGFVTVGTPDQSPFGMVVHVLPPTTQPLSRLAAIAGVQAIEVGHRRQAANDLARVTLGISADTITNANWLNLSGQNVTVEVNDSGIDQTHPDLAGRVTGDFASSLLDTDGHGTHVAGIIAGNGSESSTVMTPQGSVTNANFRGKAPNAALYSVGGVLSQNRPDIYLQEVPATNNALISNNSWVFGGDPDYDLAAASYDAATRDAIPTTIGPQPVLFVFAAGDDGGGASDGSGGSADTILSPGTAKNVITVGALEQLRDITNIVTIISNGQTNMSPIFEQDSDSSSQVADYSGRGNVGVGMEGTSGRFKPDVVAPGSWVVSTRSQQWDTNAYFNPINVSSVTYVAQVVATNSLNYYNVSVPPNAVGVTITIITNQFSSTFPSNLIIYAQQSGYPDPVNAPAAIDITTMNDMLAIPPSSGNNIAGIQSIQNNGFDFAVADSTNVAVNYDLTVAIATTNNNGDEEQVLEALDNGLAPWYRFESGTSMSAPAVSGVLALIQDYFTNTLKLTPSPALLKAMLINGSRGVGNYTYAITNGNNFQGWGEPNIQDILPLTSSNLTSIVSGANAPMFFVDQNPTNALATGDSDTYLFSINTNAFADFLQLQATLVWTDPPGDPSAAVKLVNGLELIITNLDTGDVFIGNDIDPSQGINLPVATNAPPNIDTINNVENILIPPLLAGNYSVTVVGRDVNVNAVPEQNNNVVQDYALVVSIGEGEVPDAITTFTAVAPVHNPTTDQDMSYIATTNTPLFNQFAGANTPLQGTNLLGLGTNTVWGSNGALTEGMTNQWHFYVVTNNALDSSGSSIDVTNAAFITFDAFDLSIPRMGVYQEGNPANATRPGADIDMYATTDSGLTNLNPMTLSNCLAGANNSGASLGPLGTEFVFFTNSQHGEVYYIGIKSEDQMASEFDFLPIFTATPFSQLQPNGDQLVNGQLLPAFVPDGSPAHPGIVNVFALAIYPMTIENVIVTNLNQHQNFGDLVGTLSCPSGGTSVLNNHDGYGDTYTTTIPLVYDDSPNRSPGAQHTDGPGSLTDFQGKSAVGPWILNEIDNALTHTGQVSQYSLLIQPHRNLQFPGTIVTIAPLSWFIDYVAVPPGYTNLTFYATNLPPTIAPPLQMYEKFGAAPTLIDYDFRADLTNTLFAGADPGNSISIGPPLDIGNYFIGVYNPSTTTSANVYIEAVLGIDKTANDQFTYSASGPEYIPPDVVTNSSPIFVSATQLVETVNVGIVVDSPQISDMTFTLVSPTGQRILLMENRGADSTNGAGTTFIYTNVLNSTAAGGFAANTNYLAVPVSGATIPITYDFYTVPDEMTVYEGTNPVNFYPPNNSNPFFLLDTGLTNNLTGPVTISVPTPPGITNITIIMNQFGNPYNTGGGDAWIYTAGAPSTNFEYLTFTDDSNLADVPIKFAVPPFSFGASNSGSYVLSDFERATNGFYRGPTNIYDANGGWSVPTNLVTYDTVLDPTNGILVNVTNVLVLTNNFVGVVADPADSVGDNAGTNFLALARGTITRSIPTVPGNIYNVTFWFRGPGIASWWRGEGNGSDSSDPENNANNGTLVGQFTFPAGEVDQAFQFANGGSEFDFAGTNAYVQARQSTSLDVGKAGGFTVEGWINPTNIGHPQPLVEWLAGVPTNSAVTNLVIKAGPYLDLATGHYYYLLGATNWTTSEQWAEALGGHLATISTANLQNWVFDNFAGLGGFNHNLWIGLTNSAGTNFGWSSGETNITYANWLTGQPTNICGTSIYTGILGETNAEPGLWIVADNNGVTCVPTTNVFYGVAEVPAIQTNGVQFWLSATNTPGTTNAPFATAYGSLYADIVDTNFVRHEIYSRPGLLTNYVFQHVALTYDTNSGVAMLYLNGTNIATTNFGTAFIPKTDGDVLLGHDLSPYTNNSYGGLMDEMSIYRRALSSAEILAIYQSSALTTNRLIGKFDPSITPAYGLAEALVNFGGTSNLLLGVNDRWELNSYTFKATSASMPLTISGLEPGILLDDFQVSQAPLTNLYYLPEQDLSALTGTSAHGNWTLQVWNNLTGSVLTNVSQLLSWQLSFVLQSNATFAASLSAETPTSGTVPAGQTVFFQVNVPSWAHFATNILVSSTLPVNLFYNPTNTPTGTGPGDQTLLTLANSGVASAIIVNTNDTPYPTNQAGSTYYLAVQNPNTAPAQVVLQVNYDITSLTNGAPYSAAFATNDSIRYFEYTVGSNAYEATFQLLKQTGNNDLVLSKGVPLATLTNSDYGSFNVGPLDETIYVLTNSTPVPLTPGTWYLGVVKRDTGSNSYSVLAHELDVTNGVVTNSVNVINLTSGVPFNYNAGPGTDLTNFYAFNLGASKVPGVTNYGVMFELYNLTGNGDLNVQTNGLPLAPPFFQTSQNRGLYPEAILIFTNAGLTNINLTYYLGVPSHEITNINYTIAAWAQTNQYFPGFPGGPGGAGSGASGSGGGAGGAGHAGTISTVYHVYNYSDSGPGSLRDAVSATNRTVVFDLSGIINLASPLVITNSDLTIAGQSAPGVGITVAGNMTSVTNAHDIIIRDVRFRRGAADDSLQFLDVSNSIADHVSAEWTSDNLLSVLASTNITVQWSMLAQSLYTPTNPTAIGSLLRGGSGNLSLNHNLYADNYNGSPRLGDNLSLDFVNNVVYDWGTNAGFAPDDSTNNPAGYTNYLNYTGNYLIASTNSVTNTVAFYGVTSNTWIFETNNFIDSNTNGILDGANTRSNMFSGQYVSVGHGFPLIPVPTDEAFLAYEKVLDFAGLNMPQRDAVDTNIVENVRTQTGTLISTPPLAGMVAWWRGEDNALDSIGANNGTWIGTAGYTNGEVGQAFDFDGPPGVSYVEVPDAPALDFTNTMTVEAWVNVRTYAGAVNSYEIVSKYGGPVSAFASYTFSIDPGRQQAYFIVNNAGTFQVVYSATTIPTNQWVHLAGVDDGSQIIMYVNGQFSASMPWTLGISPNLNPLVIGCTLQGAGSPTSFFNGQIDEASLYKRALTSNEVASIYNAGSAGKFGYSTAAQSKPYLDTDQDGLPDFWEITFEKPGLQYVPNNNDASTNAPGYTILEEYDSWLAGPHAVTITNTPVGVDLQRLFGGSGRLSFFVTNGFNGSVYLTNVLGAFTNTAVISNTIAWFVPTNTTPAFTGYAGFDAYVTNNDTVAYFGPVTVSVVVAGVPQIMINSNIPPVITPLGIPLPSGLLSPAVSGDERTATNYGGSDYYEFTVTNMGTLSPVAVLFTVTNATGPVDLVANFGDNLPLPSLSSYEFISTNPWPASETILISSNSTPVAITNGDWYLAVVNVAGSNVSYDISATELFSANPPVFLSPTNTDVFTDVETFPFTNTCVATDPNNPPLPLTFALASGPTNMIVTSGGLITWTPTLEQGPTTNGPSTNTIAVSVSNGDYSVINTFTIIVLGTNIAPTLPNVPNQLVIVPGGVLVVTNTGTNPNLPNYPLVYTPVNYPPGATIDSNGIITWSPTLALAGSNIVFTTVVTDTNPWAVNATSLSATNSFTVSVEPGLAPGQPQTNTVPPGSLVWIAVPVPTNAIVATNTLLFATNLPINLWFSPNLPPTITNPGDTELLANATNGSRILYTNGAPAFVPGQAYFLGVQNTNVFSVTYALKVTFDLIRERGPVTNAFPFASIVHTTINGTNGYLLTWFAPSNDLFGLQWTTQLLPPNWISFSNTVAYNPNFPATLARAQFNFFDDGTQDGGLLTLNHFYRLILLGQPVTANTLTLPAQPDLVVGPDTTLSVTNAGLDSNPYAVLTYNLLAAPAGAAINTNGVITWTTPAPGAASTNTFTTVATDDGLPPASATNTFVVIVEAVPRISGEQFTAGGLLLTWFAPSNELFQVEWRTNLISGPWTVFSSIVAYNPTNYTSPAHTQFNFFDDGSQSGPFSIPHYYALILLPSVIDLTPPSPVITKVSVAPGGTTLQWLAPTNETFKVQWTTNLHAPVLWTPFPNIISSSTGIFSFTDTNTALMMKFYELLLQ